MNTKKILLGTVWLALFALAACGGGGSDYSNGGPVVVTPTPTADAFTVAVQSTAASAPDDAEPASIDSVAATSPEDTEPVTVTI